MGSECNPNKRHYDLSMSRRTRKSTTSSANSSDQNGEFEDSADQNGELVDSADQIVELVGSGDQNGELEGSVLPTGEEDVVEHRKTLMALMDGEGKVRLGQRKQRNSLGHYFMEEGRQLALSTKKGESLEGAKLSGMVSHYLKLLNHMIKVKKRDSRFGSSKRAIVQLLM